MKIQYLLLLPIVLLSFFLITPVQARSGCCSHHGGVLASGCGCKDGTSLSATCAPYYTCKKVLITANPEVKKSTANICHKKGTTYYNQTKKYTSYNSIKECIKSGGRLPK